MKRIILVCGLIGGLISCLWWAFGEPMVSDNVTFNTRMIFGYVSILLGFSLIFVGVKSYRDNYSAGIISFGKAIKIALLITLVASTFYTLAWMINYYFFIPDFGAKLMASMRSQLIAEGASKAEIQKEMTAIAEYMEQYKNPLFNAMMTYMEILPVGIIVSIIASLILKKNPKSISDNQ
ncbi:MAG: DUF4199 domain-containing protein [Bacteroidota bacterium]